MFARSILSRTAAATLLFACVVTGGLAQFEDPFDVSVAASNTAAGPRVVVTLRVPPDHLLYADQVSVEATAGGTLAVHARPEPRMKPDPFSDEVVGIYEQDVDLVYDITDRTGDRMDIAVAYQGCDASRCFFPQRKLFEVPLDARSATLREQERNTGNDAPTGQTGPPPDWRSVADRFRIARTASGYLPADDFLSFLEGSTPTGDGPVSSAPGRNALAGKGLAATLFLILLGGLALNLTPCVLPMIPVNLAIIGAGVQGGSSRGRGFLLGGAYGLGIALVYGLLGVLVAFTGARFGALNASPWFNAAVAALFLVLSLAMFGVFHLDLARFQQQVGPSSARTGSFLAALAMGAVAALLAGACVAPVVISVLLLTVDLFQEGNRFAVLLPFLLGVGMALPWPFAGAGMSFLPKPGKWMERVKVAFGMIILVVAVYYGTQAYRLFTRSVETRTSFATRLQEAENAGRPVLIDFWATWCKNCLKMEESTFKDPAVEKALDRFVVVKYQAEDLNHPGTKAVLDYFGVQGLPTYVILLGRD